ncbi:hypothetical protein [Nocardia sp. bgisy134]|uniref:hypothetical protein n=1 Tax=Nocardia sp. bgisy134 TaxID=3413789 RepID=UPI003D72E941
MSLVGVSGFDRARCGDRVGDAEQFREGGVVAISGLPSPSRQNLVVDLGASCCRAIGSRFGVRADFQQGCGTDLVLCREYRDRSCVAATTAAVPLGKRI